MSATGAVCFLVAPGGLKAQKLFITPTHSTVEAKKKSEPLFVADPRDSCMELPNILDHPFQESLKPGGFCSCPSSALGKRVLEAACSTASLGVFDWDLRAPGFHCPPAFRERLALQEGGTVGEKLAAADRAVFLQSIRLALRSEPTEIRRLRWTTDKNTFRILAIRDAVLERNDNGAPERLIVLMQDLTVADEALQAMVSIHKEAKERVSESHTLMREMNHRVKNNLQIVCALIHSHSDGLEDPAARSSFSDIESRVRTIAHLHDRLSHGFNTLEAAGILRDLAVLVAQSSGLPADRLVLDLENVTHPLGLAQAMPFAMAANELLMNSLQHGNAGSAVTVQLRTLPDGALRLTIRNASRSAPGVSSPGLGLEIVHALCRQLGAAFHSEFVWNEAASHLVLPPEKEALRA
jgi:two-component sensor histidine kinase